MALNIRAIERLLTWLNSGDYIKFSNFSAGQAVPVPVIREVQKGRVDAKNFMAAR